jgi:hypothetical protein
MQQGMGMNMDKGAMPRKAMNMSRPEMLKMDKKVRGSSLRNP